MIRRDFLQTLELVNPALAQDNAIPIFSNFCFNGGTVFAFNDNLGIVIPCPDVTEAFAVNGKVLMDLLRASSTKDLEIEKAKDNVLLKSGKSRMKLPFLEPDAFLFTEPEKEQWDIIMDITPNLIHGLEMCLITSSTDNTMAAFMGVTVKTGKPCYLYSTDADALSRYALTGIEIDNVMQHTIRNEFCEAIIRIAEKTGVRDGQLYINGQWAFAEFGNNYKVYGKTILDSNPADFEAEVKRNVKKDAVFIDVPDSLSGALDRARVVADPENKETTVKVEGGKISLETDTTLGIVKDTMAFQGHADIEVNVSAKLMARTLKVTDRMLVLPECTAYTSEDGLLVLISNYDDS